MRKCFHAFKKQKNAKLIKITRGEKFPAFFVAEKTENRAYMPENALLIFIYIL